MQTNQESVAAFVAKATECYIRYAMTTDDYHAARYAAQAEQLERLAADALKTAQQPAAVAPEPKRAVKPRCPHYAEVKRFMAAAREKGLDVRAKDRSRAAVGMLLGVRVETRADLTGRDWMQATAAVKSGRLFW